jgi:hypothetical protein
MLAGPQEPPETVTAVKLLKTSADRTQPVHHFVDLTKNADVQVSGNTLTYKLAAVSDEKPGTYIASVWAVEKANALQQVMVTAEMQVSTATRENQIVDKSKCSTCHLGALSNKFYFHHIDVSDFAPQGNPAIDQGAPQNCKTCHNNDGYAAFPDPEHGPVSDTLVHRVHGIHFGEELKSAHSVGDRETDTPGVFANFLEVVFPKDIKNCAACHVDDRWKTKPSQLACGACHDNVWFGTVATMPAGNIAHRGGPQADNSACATCHQPDTNSVAPSITKAHDPSVDYEYDKAVLTMSPPRNGKFYQEGEKPVVTVVYNDAEDKPIDHTTVTPTKYASANLYVFGPRANAKPVLTLAAKTGIANSRASVTSALAAYQLSASDNVTKGWIFDAGDTFKIAFNGAPAQVLTAPAGAQTQAQVVSWLAANLPLATVTANAANVNIQTKITGDQSRIEIYNSPVTTKMGWKGAPGADIIREGKVVGKTSGITVEPYVIVANVSTVANDLRSTTDPNVKRNVNNITYQLDDVAGLTPGTYVASSYANLAGVTTRLGWPRDAFGNVTFQVGTETPEPKIAENCQSCHGDTVMHLNERNVHPGLFDVDFCHACHDYAKYGGTGEGFSNSGGTSTSGWAGYGAKPISARVHGVHRGTYLSHPEQVYAGNPNMAIGIIFPQDIRNCTICHDAKSSGTWKTEPSRLACMSCHDSDAAKTHGTAMTVIPPGADPTGPNATESCKTCHGAGKEFAVEKVHNISNPYKPPYPREPEE